MTDDAIWATTWAPGELECSGLFASSGDVMAGKVGYLYEIGQIIPGTQFRVVRQIGMGGMGTVYEAQEISAGRIFVIKLLHPHLVKDASLRDRLRAEAKVLASFDHENIVQVLWAGATADKPPIPFYVMERLRGRTLSRTLKRLKARGLPIPLERVFVIMECLLLALEYAHKRGVIHRDVKTENIFMHQTNRGDMCVKLLDFGIARIVGEARATQGGFVGTLGAAPPEQLRGEEPTPACDVYAAAVVFFEMLTGHVPFEEATDQQAIVRAHLFKPPTPVSAYREIPSVLDHCILRMLNKDPKARPRPSEVIEVMRAARSAVPREDLGAEQSDADFHLQLGETSVTNAGDDEEDGDWSQQSGDGTDTAVSALPSGPLPKGGAGETEEIANPEQLFRAHLAQAREMEMLMHPSKVAPNDDRVVTDGLPALPTIQPPPLITSASSPETGHPSPTPAPRPRIGDPPPAARPRVSDQPRPRSRPEGAAIPYAAAGLTQMRLEHPWPAEDERPVNAPPSARPRASAPPAAQPRASAPPAAQPRASEPPAARPRASAPVSASPVARSRASAQPVSRTASFVARQEDPDQRTRLRTVLYGVIGLSGFSMIVFVFMRSVSGDRGAQSASEAPAVSSSPTGIRELFPASAPSVAPSDAPRAVASTAPESSAHPSMAAVNTVEAGVLARPASASGARSARSAAPRSSSSSGKSLLINDSDLPFPAADPDLEPRKTPAPAPSNSGSKRVPSGKNPPPIGQNVMETF